MIAATRRSFPSPFQKFSSSSSSSSSRERSRGIGAVAKDGNPYKPLAGGPLQVERRDETAHGIRDAGQILPLPPRRPVQAADAPDDADAPRRRLEDRRLVLQETHAERIGESGDIRRMVAGVFVVPEDRPDGGGHPRPNRPHDGAERIDVVSI